MPPELMSYARFPRAARRFSARWAYLLALAFVVSLAGACKPHAGQERAGDSNAPPVHLRLLVVGDPAMAAAIELLSGEWKAQTGSTLEVQQAERLDGAKAPDVDAMVLPASDLGLAAEEQWLAAVPKQWTGGIGTSDPGRTENVEATSSWGDVFSLLRSVEAAWGKQLVAVPFGSPVLVCYYRADLLERLQARPPRTWAEYRRLAEQLGDRAALGDAAPPAGQPWSGAQEPLGPGWAGIDLLACAAAYARHRANYSALFHIESMQPLVDGPPFVRALSELVEVAKTGPKDQLELDPARAPSVLAGAVRHGAELADGDRQDRDGKNWDGQDCSRQDWDGQARDGQDRERQAWDGQDWERGKVARGFRRSARLHAGLQRGLEDLGSASRGGSGPSNASGSGRARGRGDGLGDRREAGGGVSPAPLALRRSVEPSGVCGQPGDDVVSPLGFWLRRPPGWNGRCLVRRRFNMPRSCKPR